MAWQRSCRSRQSPSRALFDPQHVAELAKYEQEPNYLDSKDYASALREAYAAEKRNVDRLGQAKAP